VVDHEDRPDELVLDVHVVDLVDDLPGAPGRLELDLELLRDPARVVERHPGRDVDPRVLRDQLAHRRSPPRRREVDRLSLQVDDRPADRVERRLPDDRLGQLHHVRVVGVGLVGLEHRELRVVARVDALVAEHAADLEDPLEAADDQTLEMQLERDPQVVVDVERVVVSDERPRRRAARDLVEDGRLDLDVPAGGERRPDRRDRPVADVEDVPRLRVHDQVEVALAHPRVRIREPAPLVRQRAQRLREELTALDVDRLLARPRDHDRAFDADPVADVELREVREALRPEVVSRRVELNAAGLIVEVGEDEAAVTAQQVDPPAN